jgi:hypothetical protein
VTAKKIQPASDAAPARKPLTDAEKAAKAKAQAEKFQELANKRVPKALKAIELVGNLSMSGYQSTPEQVEKIADALRKQLEITLGRFEKSAKNNDTFKL